MNKLTDNIHLKSIKKSLTWYRELSIILGSFTMLGHYLLNIWCHPWDRNPTDSLQSKVLASKQSNPCASACACVWELWKDTSETQGVLGWWGGKWRHLVQNPWQPGTNPQNPQKGGTREHTLQCWPLTLDHTPWHVYTCGTACIHMHTNFVFKITSVL